MLRPFRLVLLLLISLTVPGQAVAAVSAGTCNDLEHRSGEMPADHHGADADGHYGTAPAHHHDDGKGHDENKNSGHCPPCNTGAAIVSFPAVVFPDAAATSVIAVPIALSPRILPHRLDRPPRAP